MEPQTIAEAEIVHDAESGRDCLLATVEDGSVLAFSFTVEGEVAELSIVDAGPRLAPGSASFAGCDRERFVRVEDPWADDWLSAIASHPVGFEWLVRMKRAHPEAYRDWFEQRDRDEGASE